MSDKTFLAKFSSRFSKALLQSPSRILIIGFLILILTGTFLLMLPMASIEGRVGFIDALFTATSASCVTGLTVLDTGTTYSFFGQMVILFLIQIGGIGIMTFSTLMLLIAGKRPSMIGHIVLHDTFTHSGERSPVSILKNVIQFTFLIEAVGAFLLFLRFLPEKGILNGVYLSIFHSVSAFCNAGFGLFPDNFVSYQQDWFLNLVLCGLIICGGIGFLILSELSSAFPLNRRKLSRLSLHTKFVLTSTFILLILSTLVIAFMEWGNTLGELPVPDRFLASFFQAVSARTAGFNTLVIGNLTAEALFFIIVLMFIGAGPGSCAGGVKITTASLLMLAGLSHLNGKENPQIFHRAFSKASIDKAIGVVMVSLLVICAVTMLLLMCERLTVNHGKFLDLLFETVSGFGTVGLSTGVTPGLSVAGKIFISFIMFIGRVGPLTVVMAVSRSSKKYYNYAEENIMIG